MMLKYRIIFPIIFAAIFFLPTTALWAQSNLTALQKQQLEQELAQVEKEQKQAEAELTLAQQQSSSLSSSIAVLNAKIKTAQLNIKAKTLLIKTLGNDIDTKEKHITSLENRIDRGRDTLAQLMRKTNEIGSVTMPEVVLSGASISTVFEDLDRFEDVEESLKDTFEQIRSDKADTEQERNDLDRRRNTEIDARYTIEQEKKNIEEDEQSKQKLLAISKGNEKAFASVLADKRKRAAEIRAALFSLRDVAPIPFGEALQYATAASAKTGVRAAFILGIFAQESSLNTQTSTFGNHLGSCYMTDPKTGSGIYIKTGEKVENVMKPGRDVEPYIEITKALGADPYSTAVSCPLSIGYGGAMGPAQFIASTWMIIKDKLATNLNISSMPNPWNPAHAFMAAAMYLKDLGASAQTYTAERNAACRYYSGASCGNRTGNTTYGNQVMQKADTIKRTMIDPLQGV